jgi:hypothetical protein
MPNDFSPDDWQELVPLIDEAPPERIYAAMKVLNIFSWCDPSARPPRLFTGVERLLHMRTVSSGNALHRALLKELRRLSVH